MKEGANDRNAGKKKAADLRPLLECFATPEILS
jgi:hypothetical protein